MSLIGKALEQLRRPEDELYALGRFRDNRDEDAAPLGHASDAPGAEVLAKKSKENTLGDSSEANLRLLQTEGRLVVIDRSRLRAEGFLAPEKYKRQMADEYRRIKRPLLANAFGVGVPRTERGNLILISSAVSGEGKTHTCLNLALSMSAEPDRTLLLVDGDLPNPHVSRLLGIDGQPGLLDALADTTQSVEDLVIQTDIPRLSVLPAGTWTDQAPELLASNRMAEICRELAEGYKDRITLFDSPPLLRATEGQAIATHVGQIVLVIAANRTVRDDVRAALGLLEVHKPINAVLNKKGRAIFGRQYQGGYGYGAYAQPGQQKSDASDT